MLQIPDQKLKNLLLSDGVISDEQFEESVKEAGRMGIGVSNILLEKNLITTNYYQNLLSNFYKVPKANLDENQIDEKVMKLLPEEVARQKRVILFKREEDGVIDAAMEDPSDLMTIEFLNGRLSSKIKPFLASRDDLNKGLALYGKKGTEDFEKVLKESIEATLKSKISEKDLTEASKEVPIVSLTDNLLSYAIALRASDIHLEALENEILVRFRIDGILHEIMRIQKTILPAIVARFKFLSGLKLDEHYKPQDGRFRYKIGTDVSDLRVSVIPTFYGEKVEMRLLSATERPLSFQELGLLPEMIKTLKENISKTYGMVLVTGPTGSGKTTTLYSVMNAINKTEVNIVTIEDPIEYYMKYINQTQVNTAAGITFANGLRSILRQDPNIIMVGEIRDEETAEISIHAALTGHLVLSTLHTNDAPTAIPRFVDMKIESFLVSAVLNMIMAQRLVRRICLSCITSYKLAEKEKAAIAKQIQEFNIAESFQVPKTMFKGRGCVACGNTGYKGRVGIFEILSITENIRRYIISQEFDLEELRKLARKEGYQTMLEDGFRKVETGMTTLEEVLRVIKE